MSWPVISIPPEYADFLRSEPDYENNNCGKDVPTRWIGKAGEWAFKRHMEANRVPFVPVFDYEKDFVINDAHKLDMKTMARTVDPRPEYGATIFDSQYRRSTADLFAWGFLNTVTLRCFLVGWLSRQVFDKRKYLLPAGVPVTPSYTPSVDTWEVPVSILWGIDRLVEPWK